MASLYDRISKGTMSIDEITQSMEKATSEGGKFYQSMEKQSQTLSGQLSTLQDNANELLGSLTSGLSENLSSTVLPMVNNIIGELQGAFEKNGFQGLLDSATGMIPDLVGMMTGKLDDAMNGLLRWAPKLADALTASLPSVIKGLSSAIPALTTALFEVASNVVSGLITMLPELVPALAEGIFNTIGAALTGLDSLVGGIFDGIHKALVKIGADIPYVGESVQKMLDSVSQAEIDDIVKNADVDFDITVSSDDVIAEVNAAKTTIEEKLAEIDGIDASKIANAIIAGDSTSVLQAALENAGIDKEQAEAAAKSITDAQETISSAIEGLNLSEEISEKVNSLAASGASSNTIAEYLRKCGVESGVADEVALTITTARDDVSSAIAGLPEPIQKEISGLSFSGDRETLVAALNMLGLDTESIQAVLDSYNEVSGMITSGVQGVFDNIKNKLTDGLPDTEEVVGDMQSKVETLADSCHAKIDEWFNAELKKLNESGATGTEYEERLAELTKQANGLHDAVNQNAEDTSNFIASMAGKSTEYVKAHLGELQTLADTAEQIAAQIDALSPQQKDHSEVSRTLTITGVTQDKSTQFEAIALTYKEYAEMVRAAEEEYAAAIEEARKNKSGAEYAEAETAAKNALNDAKQQAADYYQNYMRQILAGIAESDPKLAGQLDDLIPRLKMSDMMQRLRSGISDALTDYQKTGDQPITIEQLLGNLNISDADIEAMASELGTDYETLMAKLGNALTMQDYYDSFVTDTGDFSTAIEDDLKSALNSEEMDLLSVVPSLAAAIQEGYLIPGINGVDYTAGGDLFNELLAGAMTVSDATENTVLTDAENLGKSASSEMGDAEGAQKAGNETAKGLDIALARAEALARRRGRLAGRAFAAGYKQAQLIASPSKVMMQLGRFSAEGLDEGLKEAMTKAVATAKMLSGQIVTAADFSQTLRVNVPNLNQEIKLANEQSSVPVNLDGQRIAEIQGLNNATRIEFLHRQDAKGYGL